MTKTSMAPAFFLIICGYFPGNQSRQRENTLSRHDQQQGEIRNQIFPPTGGENRQNEKYQQGSKEDCHFFFGKRAPLTEDNQQRGQGKIKRKKLGKLLHAAVVGNSAREFVGQIVEIN